MHKLLVTLGLVATTFTATTQALTVENTVEIVAGIMDGVIHKDNLQEIK